MLISSEAELPEDLKEYAFSADPALMHHVIAFSNMLIGESATMASEASVLGIPAFFIAKTDRGYTDEQEKKYSLGNYFPHTEVNDAIKLIEETLERDNYLEDYQNRRSAMLNDKIDVTKYIEETVLNYAKIGRKVLTKSEYEKCVELQEL